MKMFGSNYWDTLIGTTGVDTIYAHRGNDLIATNGGTDRIYGEGGDDLISGFSFNLDRITASPSRGAFVNGGSGFDTVILDINPAAQVSMLARAVSAMTAKSVDEFIFDVGTVNQKQLVVGTRSSETICTSGDASVRGMGGHDYIFTTIGDDTLSGGDGNDFLSAGLGHNTLSGGKGSDLFMFRVEPEKGYQYSNIEDFRVNSDKIAIVLDVEQTNLLYGLDADKRLPDRFYGDGLQGVGGDINDYVSYNNGRHFDSNDFHSNASLFDNFITYEPSTGSVLINFYKQVDDTHLLEYRVLVAHIDGNPNLNSDDFQFLIM